MLVGGGPGGKRTQSTTWKSLDLGLTLLPVQQTAYLNDRTMTRRCVRMKNVFLLLLVELSSVSSSVMAMALGRSREAVVVLVAAAIVVVEVPFANAALSSSASSSSSSGNYGGRQPQEDDNNNNDDDNHNSEAQNVRLYPRRTVEEAAVLEWGHSAIITALDASVALFGPQTRDAALLEVETAPVLAVPLDGLRTNMKQKYQEYVKQINTIQKPNNDNNNKDDSTPPLPEPPIFNVPIGPLDNANEMMGNLCIMTTHPAVTGVEMALMAQESGAAALLVVNIDDHERPDDIYRLPATKPRLVVAPPEAAQSTSSSSSSSSSRRTKQDQLQQQQQDNDNDDDDDWPWIWQQDDDPRALKIDIPVVMISLNSAQLLATALLDPELPNAQELARQAGFSAKYMPQRIRLYAGDDRPFFEDVEASRPTIYLIHDLLKSTECNTLIQQAERAGFTNIHGGGGGNRGGRSTSSSSSSASTTPPDRLQYTPDPSFFFNVDRVTLWQGVWMTHAAKLMEERLEQVTSFPIAHFSDFIIDRLATDGSSYLDSHFDIFGDGTTTATTSTTDKGAGASPNVPVASMTVFLSDPPRSGDDDDEVMEGGEMFYPTVLGAADSSGSSSGSSSSTTSPSPPIMVQPRKGMAVIHHSTDEWGNLDRSALHALLPIQTRKQKSSNHTNGDNDKDDTPHYFYVARKYIFMDPLTTTQRVILPLVAIPGRGRLPYWVVQLYHACLDQFGYNMGNLIFEKASIFIPVLLGLSILLFIIERVCAHLATAPPTTTTDTSTTTPTSASQSNSKTKNNKNKNNSNMSTKASSSTNTATGATSKSKKKKKNPTKQE